MNRAALCMIRLYQWCLSPIACGLGAQCRFYPSCSTYALQAFTTLSWWTAFRLTLLRLLRCHPWHDGGLDPVPPKGDMIV